MSPARALAAAWAAAFAMALAGCAALAPRPAAPLPAAAAAWSGRLSLQVPDDPNGSFAAGFELKGTPQQGELALFTPIGSTLGIVQWEPGRAVLRSPARATEYASLDELITQVAGTPIPVTALFDWLRGVATPVPGWRPNLAQAAQGRISAQRFDPPPQADLRVILER